MVGWRLWSVIAFVFFSIFTIALVLETSVFSFLPINGVFPDLVTILVVSLGFLRGCQQGAIIGFGGGLLADILTGRLIGLGGIVLALIGAFSGLMGTRLVRDRYILVLALLAVCTVLQNTLYTLGMWTFGWKIPIRDEVFGVLPYLVIYNCLLMVPLYSSIAKLNRLIEQAAIVKPKESKST